MAYHNSDRAYTKNDLNGFKIGKRIFHLLRQKGYKDQTAFAKAIQIWESEISRIMNGKKLPSLDQLKKIAVALDTSIEYIVTGEVPTDWPCENGKTSFPERFNKLKDMHHLPTLTSVSVRMSIETDTVFDRSTLSRLVNGKRKPNIEHIYILSRFFRCSMDYLLAA